MKPAFKFADELVVDLYMVHACVTIELVRDIFLEARLIYRTDGRNVGL